MMIIMMMMILLVFQYLDHLEDILSWLFNFFFHHSDFFPCMLTYFYFQ